MSEFNPILTEYIDQYCRRNRVLKSQFNWGMIPFDIMQV